VLAALALAATWIGGLFYFLLWSVVAVLILWEWTAISRFNLIWLATGIAYAGIFLAAMVLLRNSPFGRAAIFWLFASIWATDSAAYFGGRLIGGAKLWPAVSPGKTWAGAISGTIAGIAAGFCVLAAEGIALKPMHLVVGLLIVVAAQFGDLLESAIKRRFGVKDSSHLIPGHGGVMDRCDSLVAASAVALLFGIIRMAQAPAQGLLAW
jgi:phosphatidate cytidylyltransferase